MQSKDILNLAIRILGLVFLYHGLREVPPALALIVDSFPHVIGRGIRMTGNFGQFVAGLFMVAWPLLVSYWLLRGAPFILRLAFPESPASTRTEPAIGAGLGHKIDA